MLFLIFYLTNEGTAVTEKTTKFTDKITPRNELWDKVSDMNKRYILGKISSNEEQYLEFMNSKGTNYNVANVPCYGMLIIDDMSPMHFRHIADIAKSNSEDPFVFACRDFIEKYKGVLKAAYKDYQSRLDKNLSR